MQENPDRLATADSAPAGAAVQFGWMAAVSREMHIASRRLGIATIGSSNSEYSFVFRVFFSCMRR